MCLLVLNSFVLTEFDFDHQAVKLENSKNKIQMSEAKQKELEEEKVPIDPNVLFKNKYIQ